MLDSSSSTQNGTLRAGSGVTAGSARHQISHNKPLYPAWTTRVGAINCPTWPSTANYKLDEDDEKKSRYDQLVWALMHDERWHREVTLGKRIALYKFRGELGAGNFSKVKLAFHQLAHERVAVKIIDKSGLDQRSQIMLAREIASMEALRHPNIVRLYEVVETLSRVHLVLELAPGGELYRRITSVGRYSEEEARPLFAQLVSAVDHMHSAGLFHRDIKAENVFLADPFHVKLGDLGFSTQVAESTTQLATFCGSPPYAAPELFTEDSYTGGPVDIWALGVLLYFMVTGIMPFQAQTVASLKRVIMECSLTWPEHLTETCRDFLKNLLQKAPSSRLDIAKMKSHAWLTGLEMPEPLPEEAFIPSRKREDCSEGEERVRLRLEELGISEALLESHIDKGVRSAVIGTYRILMHQMDEERKQAILPGLVPVDMSILNRKPKLGLVSEGEKETINSGTGKVKLKYKLALLSSNNKKNAKSKTCVIL